MKLPKFSKSFQRVVMAVLIPSFATVSGPVQANPAGPSGLDIDAGNVAVSGLGTATVDINNFSQHAIVNWESFSIQQGEVARFNQGANAAILNRVITNNPTEIYGRLEASQGSVFLLNPNGVLVGAGGVVDVAGMMTMSTLDIDDADFRNGGDMQFSGSSNTGITNFGTISSTGGDVVLMGGFVDNKSGGQIGALNGTVAIGSGGDIILHEGGGTKISVRGASDYQGTGIENQGEVKGASVEMKAHGNVYALAINNGGAVRATGANRSNGRVRLQASGGSSNINLGQSSNIVARAGLEGGDIEVKSVGGTVAVAGNVDARGTTVGGNVSLAGTTVTQAAGSLVTASGAQAAGSVSVDAVDSIILAGAIETEGIGGSGGEVTVTASRIVINDGADLSADGATTGGRLRVGGDFQGIDNGLREADSLRVEAGARLSADSLSGDAGTVIAWANQDTIFVGDVSASARGATGNGGLIEVSGKKYLYFDGTAAAHSVGGKAGTVLFDPGDVIIGAAGPLPALPPLTIGAPPLLPAPQVSTVSITSVNDALQNGSNVLIITDDGNIFVNPVAGDSNEDGVAGANDRNSSIQWTNSNASFGAFASGVIVASNHIRTSGAGSINLLAGWTGSEGDFSALGVHTPTGLDLNTIGSVQGIWDHYVEAGAFGATGGSIFVGSPSMVQHVQVGSRFGDTNLAGFEVRVTGSDINDQGDYAQVGFHDGGQVFAPRLNRGLGTGNFSATSIALDLSEGAGVSGLWYLSDGQNFLGQAANGIENPIAAVAGMFEVDMDGDGIADGVRGINSTGALSGLGGLTAPGAGDTFIPYATHYNSSSSGNWWWQRIDAAKADPLGLGGLRPENGAGIGEHSAAALALIGAGNFDGADINVIARSNVILQGGADGEGTGAMIGHGGFNHFAASGLTFRENAANNGAAGNVQNNTAERRWSFNGTTDDRTGTAIARLAPVYGNINVLAGVDATQAIAVDHLAGTVTAAITNTGDVNLRASQIFGGAGASSHSPVQIGHGGNGQFGEFYGDIKVLAGGNINLLAGEGNRAAASIGHTVEGFAYWNPTSQVNQQIRFFATLSDFDNPNLNRGELFTGVTSTGFNPDLDPIKTLRVTLATHTITGTAGFDQSISIDPGNIGNYVPHSTGTPGTASFALVPGVWRNIHNNELINTNPLAYAGGASGPGTATLNDTVTPTAAINSRGSINLSRYVPGTSIKVDALDGSIVNGFHGDITVQAKTGNIQLKAFMTEGVAGSNARERRFAQIGHGGTNFAHSVSGAGYQNILGIPATPNGGDIATQDGRDIVTYHTAGVDGDQTGSRSDYGAGGSANNRSVVFMSITGDIDVQAGQNIDMTAGNDIYDFTQIGHGGAELADYESSSFILGDISVDAGGNINVIGGGGVQPINRGSRTDGNQRNYDLRAWSQIGHGGYQTGFLGFLGDIEVIAGGNIHIQNGAFSYTFAKIGHQGALDYGQSGGSYVRDEMFRADRAETDIRTDLDAGSARVAYSSNVSATNLALGRAVVGARDFTANGAGTLVGSDRNTADISVTAGGSITLDHMAMGQRQPEARLAWLAALAPVTTVVALQADAAYDAKNQTLGIRTRNSFAQIGHGGINTDELYNSNNTATNYGDKIGNISVVANGGNLALSNGEGTQRWTRIGHGVGVGDAASDPGNVGFSRAIELAGNISVSSSRDIIIDASVADEDEKPAFLGEGENLVYWGNINTKFGSNASVSNPVAIGHGGIDNNNDVVVLGQGEVVNGIVASSNITASAGLNMSIIGGNGTDASSAQLGHGHRSPLGANVSRRFGVPTGFSGHIDVTVQGDLLIQGGANAWTTAPNATDDRNANSVHGAFAAIGHGGYLMDAPSWGDISVYVGNNLDIKAQHRTDGASTGTVGASYFIKNNAVGSLTIASAYNFAKIGHFAVENSDRLDANGAPLTTDVVTDAGQIGDITVVVGNDLTMTGGTIDPSLLPDELPSFDYEEDGSGTIKSNVDTHTIYGAFAQIGHGGPSIQGDLVGNITVLVDGNISVSQGANLGVPGVDSIALSAPMNNYAMIGNGDYLNGIKAVPGISELFRRHSQGIRFGDIIVSAGNNASFDGALIGHADPRFASLIPFSFGNTFVAASRLFPFYDEDALGFGTLSAVNGTVFSSGGYGVNSGKMTFYVPSRSRNKMNNTTRINEATATFVEAPLDFADVPVDQGGAFDPTAEKLAGRNDEVYLTPDLWWDDLGEAAAAGVLGGAAFPTNNNPVSQGGSIALVDAPGGFPNLVALVPGALGSSAALYRDNNGVSGAGYYTLYYDAIESVTIVPPYVPPVIPPYTGPPLGDYDFLDRSDGIFGDGYGGGGDSLYSNLGLFETDESTQERSGVSRFENAIDNAFGPSRDSTSEEEEDEEERRRKRRAAEKVGPIGLTYYVYDPATNRLSSYRVFGTPSANMEPANQGVER